MSIKYVNQLNKRNLCIYLAEGIFMWESENENIKDKQRHKK